MLHVNSDYSDYSDYIQQKHRFLPITDYTSLMPWMCAPCGHVEQDDSVLICAAGEHSRYASYAVMVASHVLEHLADGLAEPLDVLKAMQARPIKAYGSLSLAFVAQQMRLLTKDTTTLARQIAKARASRAMLDVLETGDTKDKIAVLKGIQVLGDVVQHTGEVTTRFVVETHGGAPPPREDE